MNRFIAVQAGNLRDVLYQSHVSADEFHLYPFFIFRINQTLASSLVGG
jgi:hypothetical protein